MARRRSKCADIFCLHVSLGWSINIEMFLGIFVVVVLFDLRLSLLLLLFALK